MYRINNERTYLEVKNRKSSLKIALEGAHIFHFQRKSDDTPLLFLSKDTLFKKGVPLRGGIPICWPYFGKHPTNPSLPNHGFARTSLWKHDETKHLDKDTTSIHFTLESSKESLATFAYEFTLHLEIRMSDTLALTLTTTNTSKKAFTITQALHTYLHVNDSKEVSIEALNGCRYYDKVDNSYDNIQNTPLLFNKEIDRIYQNVAQTLKIVDSKRCLHVTSK